MKKKKTVIVISILLIILIALAGVIIYLLLGRDKEPENQNDGVYIMNEENYAQITDEMAARVEEGYFETYMTTEWVFPDGATESADAVLGNSPSNTKPIRCEVTLTDTGEVVYSTGVIPVGAQVPAIKLEKDLDAGTYSAVCMIYLLDEADGGTYTEYSSAGFDVTIVVQN